MKKVSILVPCYNEEESLPIFYAEMIKVVSTLKNYLWEFLFINDGSKDNTLNILKSMRLNDDRVSYLDLSRNFGKENAMLAGFDYVTGDCTIILDADLQDPPELIPQMLLFWEEGYDDVFAKRSSREGETFMKKITSKIFYKILQKVSAVEIQKDTGDFRLLDKQCVKALINLRESQRYTKGLFSWIGFKKKEILFDRLPRVAGKTKWNYWALINLAIEGLTSYSTFPLRMASILGISLSISSFVFMFIKFFKALIYGDLVKGYPSLIVIILFIGGVQLLFLGIIGEYIGRIFNETKHRPPYIAREFNGIRINL